MRRPFPIDPRIPEILEALRRGRNLVVEAPPGAGKTTRVPPALLDLGGEVWVLEPRRLAARMAARRVAAEMGEQVGETVGYQVRFDEVAGPETRIRFLTEGILARKLLSDPELRRAGTVVLDEFHERHLESDLALALLRRLQRTARPDLRLVVMSATLDAKAIAGRLDAPVVRSEGRLFPLEIRHTRASIPEALESVEGDVLVFLPGAREIREAMTASDWALRRRGAVGLPLYGDLPLEEQDRALAPSTRPKVIFATNVAESSLTIEGITAVIDTGLARVASDSPWTGLPSLDVVKISQAAATQRAGRAARTAPGIAVRLYATDDFARRASHETPEILRRELSQMLLVLRSLRVDPRELEWIDQPPEESLAAAVRLLDLLKADGRLARYPVHPRLARLIEDAGEEGATLAARLIRDDRIKRLGRGRGEFDIQRAALRAFPDRVAKQLRGEEYLLAAGGSALLRDHASPWIVALDIERRSDQRLPVIRDWMGIEPDWLLDEFPERILEREIVEWNRDAERVDAVRRLEFERLAILEERGAPEDGSELLAEKALEAGIERFVNREELAQFLARAEFVGAPVAAPELEDFLRQMAVGRRSFRDLTDIPLAGLRPNLDRAAPRHIPLPNGRRAPIQYISGQAPSVASRLQDFFGMRETPKINGVPLVVHLLAPNKRPVQMTQDLGGFWQRLYPQVRRELMRRYPKHRWPEDPDQKAY